MPTFRKKPVVIEAFQVPFDGDDCSPAMETWLLQGGDVFESDGTGAILIHTLEGTMRADPLDWIIKGVKGEFYPCKPDIFAATYEPVEAAAQPPPPAEGTTPSQPFKRDWKPRDIKLLRETLSKLCHFVWHGRTEPGVHMWSIPADKERDFDCILSDAISELEALRAASPAEPTRETPGDAFDRVVAQLIHDRAGLLGLIGKLIDAKEAAEAKCATPLPLSTLEQAVREAVTEAFGPEFQPSVRDILVRALIEKLAPRTAGGTATGWQAEIQAERDRQDAQWGGPEHDDTHSMHDWLSFIGHQVELARRGDSRGRLVKIAALAVAAMQSQERKAKLPAHPAGASERQE